MPRGGAAATHTSADHDVTRRGLGPRTCRHCRPRRVPHRKGALCPFAQHAAPAHPRRGHRRRGCRRRRGHGGRRHLHRPRQRHAAAAPPAGARRLLLGWRLRRAAVRSAARRLPELPHDRRGGRGVDRCGGEPSGRVRRLVWRRRGGVWRGDWRGDWRGVWRRGGFRRGRSAAAAAVRCRDERLRRRRRRRRGWRRRLRQSRRCGCE